MSNTRSIQEPPAPPDAGAPGARPPAGQPTAAELESLVDHLRGAERHIAAAVRLAGRLASSGVCEKVEGLPLEHFLGLAARLTGADRRMLVTAGEVLATLPVTAQLFADGVLSWGQVRALVATARRLRAADRATLDARLAATLAERGSLAGFDPDQLVDAVHAAVDDLRQPRDRQRSEARRRDASFLSLQAGFDGGVCLYGEVDPVLGATVVNALDAAAGPPTPESGEDGHPAGDPPGDGGAGRDNAAGDTEGAWSGTGRGRQYARALGRICADWLGGDLAGRPARPLFVAHVNTGQARSFPDGTIELAVRGGLSRISTATLEQFARDADLRAVLFDGARPLAVSGKVSAGGIPINTRRAVAARDQGCRFPGSSDPLAHTDVHHLIPRACGGDHHPDNLVSLSRRYHTLTHRYDWTLTLDPATGEVTARRGRRAWRSLPRATALSPLPDTRPLGPAGARGSGDSDAGGGRDRATPDPEADRAPPDLPF